MYNSDLDLKTEGILGIVCIVLLIICWLGCTISDSVNWNYGIHDGCGGHWVYEQAVGHRFGTDYMYKCDKCGYRHEFTSYMGE